jgi:hypothetical protein
MVNNGEQIVEKLRGAGEGVDSVAASQYHSGMATKTSARELETLLLRVSPQTKRAMRFVAADEACTMADIGRRAIEAYLAARGNGAAAAPADHAAPTGDAGQ